MVLTRRFAALAVLLAFALPMFGKEPGTQVINWPESGTPVLRFTFAKFKKLGAAAGQTTYVADTTVDNLWSKRISRANFALYVFDEKKTRIGEAIVTVSDIGPGETIRFQTTMGSAGAIDSIKLVADYLPPELGPAAPRRLVAVTVNSIPQGAQLKVDGVDAGTTPKVIQVPVGKHRLEFIHEGFNNGTFPLEITPSDASGGVVSYELGSAVHDTVELRDGSVLSGDLESVSANEVVVRIGGKDTTYERNQVKRILLVERAKPDALPPPVQAGSPNQ